MKKRTLIIPIAVLVLLAVFCVAEVCLCTDFLYNDSPFYSRNVQSDHKAIARDIKTNIKMSERAYNKDPGYANLTGLAYSYFPSYYVILGEYRGELGEDYLAKSMEYSKKAEEFVMNNYDETGIVTSGDPARDEVLQYHTRVGWVSEYVFAQYLTGERQQAIDTVESIVQEGFEKYNINVSNRFNFLISYLCNDKSVPAEDKQWAQHFKETNNEYYIANYTTGDITINNYFDDLFIYKEWYDDSVNIDFYGIY